MHLVLCKHCMQPLLIWKQASHHTLPYLVMCSALSHPTVRCWKPGRHFEASSLILKAAVA